jgi:hypothetical protein
VFAHQNAIDALHFVQHILSKTEFFVCSGITPKIRMDEALVTSVLATEITNVGDPA